MENRKEYDMAKKEFITWLKLHYRERAKRSLKAKVLVQLGYLRRLAATLKIKSVGDHIENFLYDSDGKILLGTIHRSISNYLVDRFNGTAVLIDGTKSVKERQMAEERFQTQAATRIMVGQIKAAGVGLNLTAAHTVGMVELPWKPADCEQFEDRAYARLNDLHGADVYYYVAENSIEQHMCNIIQTKQKVCDRVIDGEVMDDGIAIFDQLMEMMLDEEK
jgi:SWI/SNF-related matrix-associated actin-dependent regulator 1 of chromatin subfamily A